MSAMFAGQTALVAGGTRGIGRAIALDLLQHGAKVWAIWHSNQEAAASLADEAARFDDRLVCAPCDVTDEQQVGGLWERVREASPQGVQMLVVSAGIRRDALAAMMRAEDWQKVLDTNLRGSFLMAKQALLSMLPERYGRIVFLTSPAARYGFEGQANYAASKAGQIGMMRSMAKEVAARGITVNCVSPGFVETEMLADLAPKLRAEYERSVPLKRFAQPAEIAYAVRCLLAREAAYVTGATLEVAGGL